MNKPLFQGQDIRGKEPLDIEGTRHQAGEVVALLSYLRPHVCATLMSKDVVRTMAMLRDDKVLYECAVEPDPNVLFWDMGGGEIFKQRVNMD